MCRAGPLGYSAGGAGRTRKLIQRPAIATNQSTNCGVQAAMNHLDPAIVTASRLFGGSEHHEHHVIRIEYQEFGDDRHQQSIQSAHATIPILVQQLTQKMGV